MKKLIPVCGFILMLAVQTIACDCFVMWSHRKEFRKSKAVFVGEVVKIERQTEEERNENTFSASWKNELVEMVTLRVVKSWKGSKKEVVIWSHAMHYFCNQWNFKVGEKYLIYAQKNKGLLIGAQYCFRTRPLETTDKKELEEFRELDSF